MKYIKRWYETPHFIVSANDDVESQPSATHRRLCPYKFNAAPVLQGCPCSLRNMLGALSLLTFIAVAMLGSSYSFVLRRLSPAIQQPRFAFRRLGRHTSVQALSSTMVEKNSGLTDEKSEISPLPWTESIKATRNLTYMPMLRHHLEMMKELDMTEVSIEEEFVYQNSKTRPARIASMCFQNDKFRKVRFTYFDAGDAVQV